MTTQAQKIRRQFRTKFQRDLKTFLRSMTVKDLDNIVARTIANRQAAGQEA